MENEIVNTPDEKNPPPPPPPKKEEPVNSIPPPPPPPVKKKDITSSSVSTSTAPVTNAPSESEGGTSGLTNGASAQQGGFQWNPVEAEKQYNRNQGIKTPLGNKIAVTPKDLSPVDTYSGTELGGNQKALSIQGKVQKDVDTKKLVDYYDKTGADNKPLGNFYLDYLKEHNPDEYQYNISKFEELSKKSDKLDLQKFEAEQAQKALELKTRIFSGKYDIAKNIIKDNYQDKLDTYNNSGNKAEELAQDLFLIDNQLKQYPTDDKGNIAADATNRKEIENLLNTRKEKISAYQQQQQQIQTLQGDQDFNDALSLMNDVGQKYEKVATSYYDMATQNPEAFKNLPEYKKYIEGKQRSQRSADFNEQIGGTDMGIAESMGRSVTTALSKIAYIPKALTSNNKYGWTDKLYEGTRDLVNDFNDEYLPLPSDFNKPLVQNGQWNLTYLPAKISGTVADMGLMALASAGVGNLTKLGMSGELASSLGAFTSGYVMTASEYYEEARQAGMGDKEATSFSRGLATQQALLELISPNEKLVTPQKLKGNFEQYTEMIGKGASRGDAAKEFLKNITANLGKEVGQEELQTLDEIANKHFSNEMSGANDQIRQSTADQMAETALVTILSTFGLSAPGSFKSKSMMNKQALFMAAHAPEKIMPAVQSLISKNILTQDQANGVIQQVNLANKALQKIDPNINDEHKLEVLQPLMEKMQLEEKKQNVDQAFKPAVEEQIKQKEEEIKNIVSGELTPEERDEKDYLTHVKETVGLEDAEASRLEELNKKIAKPQAKEEGEAKTKENAVQEQTTTEGMLRDTGLRGESGLQSVEQHNESKKPAEQGKENAVKKEEVIPTEEKKPEEQTVSENAKSEIEKLKKAREEKKVKLPETPEVGVLKESAVTTEGPATENKTPIAVKEEAVASKKEAPVVTLSEKPKFTKLSHEEQSKVKAGDDVYYPTGKGKVRKFKVSDVIKDKDADGNVVNIRYNIGDKENPLTPASNKFFSKSLPTSNVEIVKIAGKDFTRTVNDKGVAKYIGKDGVELPNDTERYRQAEENYRAKKTAQPAQQQQEEQLKENITEKPKTKEDISDEELVPVKEDDKESVDKLNKDIAAMKAFDKKDLLEKKYKGMLERAFKMKDEGKISRPTYTEYKKKAQQILGGKLNLDKEELGFKVDQYAEELKKKLLGEGYKKIVLSSTAPVTPQNIADLIDLTANLVKRGINAGFTIKEAVDKALVGIKKHPTYKKLLDSKEFDEKEFDKTVRDAFPEEKKSESKEDIHGEKRVHSISKRQVESEKLKNVSSRLKEKGITYESIDQKKATAVVNQIIEEHEKEAALIDLADSIIAGKSEVPYPIQGLMAAKLTDKLNVIAEKESNEFTKQTTFDKAAELSMWWADESTKAGQFNGVANQEIANSLPSSKEGLRTFANKELEKLHDKLLTPEEKKQIEKATKEINDLLTEEDLSEEQMAFLNKLVAKKIQDISEELNGKEYVENIKSVIGSLKMDLSEC